MFKRILIPLDGSKTAEAVLPVAAAEAKAHGAILVLLRAIAPLRQSLMTSPAAIANAYAQVEPIAIDYLRAVADKLRSEGIAVEIEIDKGPPAQRILAFAEEKKCDLIIIGTHGETGAFQWRFGSVANKVVKAKTTFPVMVITT